MSLLGKVHETRIFPRRVERLAELLAQMIPPGASVLDVGCGDGLLDSLLLARRPDIRVEGTDVLLRPHSAIPVRQFDGSRLPYADRSFDTVLFVDVLHHTSDPMVLLREAVRVSGKSLVIKDHLREGLLAGLRLRVMDYVGNARHGVALPYNYWRAKQWERAQHTLDLRRSAETRDLHLYPGAADYFFGAGLHFLARFEVN
jgi:SAM-dependent methyltransferase